MKTIMPSTRYTLDRADLISIGQTMLWVIASAIISELIIVLPTVDFGKYTTVVVLIVAILQLIKKFLDGQPKASS